MVVQNFKKVLLFSGLYNVLFALPLLIPGLSISYLHLINRINDSLQLGGMPFISNNDPLIFFLINAAGTGLVTIGIMIMYVSGNPVERKGIIVINIIGRLIFSVILFYYIFFGNLLRIVIVFGIVDLIICGLFIYYLRKIVDMRITNLDHLG